jgi:hypothetical protein
MTEPEPQEDRVIRFADVQFLITGGNAYCLRARSALDRSTEEDDLLLALSYRAALAKDLKVIEDWIALRRKQGNAT